MTSERRAVFAVFGLSLLLTLSYVLLMEGRFKVDGDAGGYDRGGYDLALGRGFPVEGGGLQPKREPGMYVFLAGIYLAFGHDYRAARIIQAILASTFCLLVYAVARRLARGNVLPPRAPLVAALLTALYPAFVLYSGVLLRETLLTFFILASLVYLTDYVVSGRLSSAAVSGVFTGLGALVDGRAMYFPIFFGIVSFMVRLKADTPGEGLRRVLTRSAAYVTVAFGTALVVVAPWTIRNYLVFDRFVLLATQQHKGLWLATNPQGMLEWDWTREPLKSLRDLPLEQRDEAVAVLARQNLRDHPVLYVRSSVGRFFRLWAGGHSNVAPVMEKSVAAAATDRDWGYLSVKLLFVAINAAYVLGGAVGAVLYVRRYGLGPGSHLVGLVLYFSLLHMMLFATPRYHVPAIPALIVFMAYLLSIAHERWALGRVPLRPIAVGAPQPNVSGRVAARGRSIRHDGPGIEVSNRS